MKKRADYEKIRLATTEEVEHYKYLLSMLLPYLRQLHEEQVIEKKIEAKRHGVFLCIVLMKITSR